MSGEADRPVPPELSPGALVRAYAAGIFPMPDAGDESKILWFSPDPRGLLPLDGGFHVSRRLGRTIRQGRFVCTADRAFAAVMRGCAGRAEGTWITADFLSAYGRLHRLGLAHSVEARPADDPEGPPVGGVYGVALGGAFFAESMFHTAADAGKVALACLIDRLRARGFVLCDVQWVTPHLRTLGAIKVSRARYLRLLAAALRMDVTFGPGRRRPGQGFPPDGGLTGP